MAESKRQSMAGKIATPNVGPSKFVLDKDSILYRAIGARVRVTCAPHDTVLEGILFTTCSITNAIAINTAPAPPNPSAPLSSQPGDYHIIPFAHIVSLELVGPGERDADAGPGLHGLLPHIGKVDLDAANARTEQTIREMKKKDAQKGKGVSREAQELFDFIARTLPTRWHDAQIIVNDNVLIEPPYTVDNIKAPATGAQSVAHVRKVVESFYQKKRPGNGRAPVATPIAPRKGG